MVGKRKRWTKEEERNQDRLVSVTVCGLHLHYTDYVSCRDKQEGEEDDDDDENDEDSDSQSGEDEGDWEKSIYCFQ